MINEWIIEVEENRGNNNTMIRPYTNKNGQFIKLNLVSRATGEVRQVHISLESLNNIWEEQDASNTD